MVITLLIGNYNSPTDGTIMSARRFADGLKERGHTVRIVSNDVEGDDMYCLKPRFIPIVSSLAKKQNQIFLKFDKKIMIKALQGADVVHCYLPWKEAKKTQKLAKKMGVAFTLAFHWQPEHITYNMGFQKSKGLVNYIYRRYRKMYNKVDHIHVPTQFMKNKLIENKYRSTIHPISNGITSTFKPLVREYDSSVDDIDNKEVFNIISVGRLSPEKNHINIIDAIKLSKYKDKIQLYIAGKGPLRDKIINRGSKLPLAPIVNFFDQKTLQEKIYQSDLFIHSSNADTEGISCIEAIACGRVPIIADSKKSAATIFSMHKNSLYKANDAQDLADKIDFWIENAKERVDNEKVYSEGAKEYSIDKSLTQFEEMLSSAKRDCAILCSLAKKENKHKSKQFGERFSLLRFFGTIFYYIIICPLVFLINRIYFGTRYKNRKYLRQACRHGKGAVTVCNHIHELDVIVYGLSTYPKKPIFTSLSSNFKIPVAGQIINFLGAVPVPNTAKDNQMFFYLLTKQLRKGRVVHIFPEGKLVRYDDELRDFYKGAFQLSKKAEVPIVPIRIVYRKPKGLYKIFKKRPLLTVVYGKPLVVDYDVESSEQVKDLQNRTFETMQTFKNEIHAHEQYDFAKISDK